jgi:hypothetical protein
MRREAGSSWPAVSWLSVEVTWPVQRRIYCKQRGYPFQGLNTNCFWNVKNPAPNEK